MATDHKGNVRPQDRSNGGRIAHLGGRHRRPMTISGTGGIITEKETATTVTPIAAGVLNDALTDATAGENGYATGNASHLHIQIENDGTDDTLTLYAYNYAFGAWAQYYSNIGVGDTETVVAAYVLTKWTTINGKFMVTVPIHGIDRIAFVHDGTLNDMVVRAAVSTF